uniref:Uncharacterized protein n=1 Tax=Clastoptera arizonana TaxID=38151 RepID=A0A1B6D948_9HEMI
MKIFVLIFLFLRTLFADRKSTIPHANEGSTTPRDVKGSTTSVENYNDTSINNRNDSLLHFKVNATVRPRGRIEVIKEVQRTISHEELVLPTDPPKENLTLAELDKRITKAMMHPSTNINKRLQLLKDTFQYYSEVDDIADAFVVDPIEGIKVINESGVLTKPKFIDIKYNEDDLQNKYGWEEKEIDELFSSLGGCRYVWERVHRLLSQTTTEQPTTVITTTTIQTTSTTSKIENYTQISAETIEFSEVPAS